MQLTLIYLKNINTFSFIDILFNVIYPKMISVW